jgi:hypothetical protein
VEVKRASRDFTGTKDSAQEKMLLQACEQNIFRRAERKSLLERMGSRSEADPVEAISALAETTC